MDTQGLQARQAVLKTIRGALLLIAAATCGAPAAAEEPLPPVLVYPPSPCLACIDWADHLRKNGFEVSIEETPIANMPRLKRWLNVPAELESVHTSKVAGYFIVEWFPEARFSGLVGATSLWSCRPKRTVVQSRDFFQESEP